VAVTPEVLVDLIKDAETTRASMEAERFTTEGVLRKLVEAIDEVSSEEHTYRATLRRRFPNYVVEATTKSTDHTLELWTNLSRNNAVENAIKEVNAKHATVSPADIEECLKAHGRSDDRDQIGGATAYLNREKRIHSLGRGRWVFGPARETPRNDFGPAVEAGPREASDNEISGQGAIITGAFGPS